MIYIITIYCVDNMYTMYTIHIYINYIYKYVYKYINLYMVYTYTPTYSYVLYAYYV